MDYSLLLGIHVLDKKPLSRGSRCDSKRGQKVLYSTALESIQGNLKDPEPVTDDDTYVDDFKGSSPTGLAFCPLLFTCLGLIFQEELLVSRRVRHYVVLTNDKPVLDFVFKKLCSC